MGGTREEGEFSGLFSLCADVLNIVNNKDLSDLSGLSSLERITQPLLIVLNPTLPTCEAEWLRDNIEEFGQRQAAVIEDTLDGDLCVFN